MIELDKIHLGDCYELIKRLPDKSIDLVYTDIPYLFVKAGAGDSSVCRGIRNTFNSGSFNRELIDGIDYGKLFPELVRVMKNIYIWCSKDQILDIMNYFTSIPNRKVRYNILVWCKTNPTPMCNGNLLPDLEYCLLFKEEGSQRYNDGIENKSKWYISAKNKKDKDEYGHPTIKPLDLVERHLKLSTIEGQVVLDPFMGSGTTAVACKETGRHYIGFEINPEYHKIACDRLMGITKKESDKGFIQERLF